MIEEKLLLRSLSNETTMRPPIWFMRQAGRYLPEYKEVREKAGSFWNLCFTPELAAEVTLQPMRKFDFDAAIIFSDILIVPHALGQKVDFKPDHGPILEAINWRKVQDNFNKKNYHQKLQPTYNSLALVKSKLKPYQALIGFSGAPWTLATYMINLGKSASFAPILNMLLVERNYLLEMLDVLTFTVADYLIKQLESGADVVKIFDSWAEVVPEKDRREVLLKPLGKIVSLIRQKYPKSRIIYFGRKATSFYEEVLKEIPDITLAFDQDANPVEIRDNYQTKVPVQGNLDPALLLKGGKELIHRTQYLLETLGKRAYIFNLGHGILPQTPPSHVSQVIDIIKKYKG